jgi:hypothetical protein
VQSIQTAAVLENGASAFNWKSFFFWGMPFLWLTAVLSLKALGVYEDPSTSAMAWTILVANVVFFGTTHAGATFYFVFADARGRAWRERLAPSRKTFLTVACLVALCACVAFFALSRIYGWDPFQYIVFLNLWTAWHAFRQSESLFFTIDRGGFERRVLAVFRFLFMLYAIYLLLFSSYKNPAFLIPATAVFAGLVTLLNVSAYRRGNARSALFGLRFYLWAFQFAEPLLGVGTFAIHGIEYLYINGFILEKMKGMFLLFMAVTSFLFVAVFYRENLFFGYFVLPFFFFSNIAHYILDRAIFQYRYEFERTEILSRLEPLKLKVIESD